MSQHLCITLRFLTGSYHGKISHQQPEWPPAPLRLFQALLCAAACRWRGEHFKEIPLPALRYLEHLDAPIIWAPVVTMAKGYRSYVPDNVGDLIASSWSRGGEKDISGNRTEKDIRPAYLNSFHSNQDQPVYYIWKLPEKVPQNILETLQSVARSITHVGWGVDMVSGNAELMDDTVITKLHGECWLPHAGSSTKMLRVPRAEVLDSLLSRYDAFLNRVARDNAGELFFQPVPGIRNVKSIPYRRANDPAPQRCLAFTLLKTDASAFRPFNSSKTVKVAGMLRFALNKLFHKRSYPAALINQLILGHAEKIGDQHQPVAHGHIQYVPLPSIETRTEERNFNHIGMTRRALLIFPDSLDQQIIDDIKFSLTGQVLIDERSGKPQALLSLIPLKGGMIDRYIPKEGAATWSTVTPMILPGQDDRKDSKTEKLIRKAMLQAGLPESVVNQADVDWRKSGFWSGAEYAHKDRFMIPPELQKFPVYHVRIQFCDEQGKSRNIPGPLILGSGRYKGLGLFAAEQ